MVIPPPMENDDLPPEIDAVALGVELRLPLFSVAWMKLSLRSLHKVPKRDQFAVDREERRANAVFNRTPAKGPGFDAPPRSLVVLGQPMVFGEFLPLFGSMGAPGVVSSAIA